LFVSNHSVEPIFIRLEVKGINKLSDFVDDFFRGLIYHDFFAQFLSQGFFYWAYCCCEQGYLLKFSIIQPLGKIFVWILFGVVRKDNELINRNIEQFQSVQLFFVVGIADDDVAFDFIQLSKVINLWNDVFER
jgi:hypothetical protein